MKITNRAFMFLAGLSMFSSLCQRAYGLDESFSQITLERENIRVAAKIAHPAKLGSCNLELKIENQSSIQYGILETNSNAFAELSLVSRRDGTKCALTERGTKLFRTRIFGLDYKILDPGQSVTIVLATKDIFEIHPDYWELSFKITLVPAQSNPKKTEVTKIFVIRQLEFDVTK